MQEVFSKIIEKLERLKTPCELGMIENGRYVLRDNAIEIVKQEAEKFCTDTNVWSNGWIPCSVAMPPVETEVFIVAKRKYRGGEVRYITTTAMYEDGTVLENDSCWRWEDIEGEWDEENDCYIIPEGWWENRHYNPDEVYNNVIDDEVIAWQPIPLPFRDKE